MEKRFVRTRLLSAAAVFSASLFLFGAPGAANAASLSASQVQAILSLLSAFGADSATVAQVSAALRASTPTSAAAASGSVSASLITRPSSGPAPLSVEFSVRASASTTAFSIDYGDGATGIPALSSCSSAVSLPCAYSAAHTYASGGTYQARLVANGAVLGSALIAVAKGSSSGFPAVSAIDGPSALSIGQTGTWSVHASVAGQPGASLAYAVHWGDEGSSVALSSLQSSNVFTHAYSAAGTYAPWFSVVGSAGPVRADAPSVPVRAALVAAASLSASPASGTLPLPVTFTGSTGLFCGGQSFTLQYGDGASAALALPASSCGGSFTMAHTYTMAGTYTARVTDNAGNTYGSASVIVISSLSAASIDASTLTSTTGIPHLTGTAPGASTVEVFINGSNTAGAFSEGSGKVNVVNGRFTYDSTRSVPLPVGSYAVTLVNYQTGATLGTATFIVTKNY